MVQYASDIKGLSYINEVIIISLQVIKRPFKGNIPVIDNSR